MQIDYLVIGQGLAGSLLAWELIQRKQKVIIVDNAHENASLIAAGLINPVTGMRFVKAPEIDWLLPSARDYYQKLGHFFQEEFFVDKGLLRILKNNKEKSAVEKRLQQTEYQDYLVKTQIIAKQFDSLYGVIHQKQTGFLKTRHLLTTLKDYFISNNAYIESDINYNDISLGHQPVWKHYQTKNLIFCEGHSATNNPWFNWLPFQPVKGEIITATTPQVLISKILLYGNWLIPISSHQFRTGATFDHDTIDTQITTSAKALLFDQLNHIYPGLDNSEILAHQAGIRPATLDKQPFLGRSSTHPELAIFNGFGAKGSLLIPWHCQKMSDHLINNSPLPDTCDIQRYISRKTT